MPGVYIQSKSSASLQNCTVSGCGTEGVNVNKGTATLTNCLITGNGRQQQSALYNSIGYGVHILNGAKVTMRGGKVNSNLGYGVLCGNGKLDVQGSAKSYAEFMYNAWSGLSFSGRKTYTSAFSLQISSYSFTVFSRFFITFHALSSILPGWYIDLDITFCIVKSLLIDHVFLTLKHI